jgi:hypothetical protein
MEQGVVFSGVSLRPRTVLSSIIFPFLTNLSILLFEIFAIKVFQASSDPTNVIGVLGLFVYYFGCLVLFVAYGRSTGGWNELFGRPAGFLVVTLVITYPIFFLFWLPLVIWQLVMYVGSPKELWQREFQGTVMSIEKLYPDYVNNQCQRYLRFIYIGIPFVLFSIIVIILIIALTPLWYFLFSPLGLGTCGVALHISLHFPHSTEGDFVERIETSARLGIFFHVWLLALPFAVFALVHLIIVGVTWYGILLAICALLQFAVDVGPGTKGFCQSPHMGRYGH